MYVTCAGLGSNASCSVENRGERASSICWDAVTDCEDGAHRSHSCSGEVPAHATQSFSMPEFSPPIAERAGKCRTFRVEAQSTK
jgi:hypothetical protein